MINKEKTLSFIIYFVSETFHLHDEASMARVSSSAGNHSNGFYYHPTRNDHIIIYCVFRCNSFVSIDKIRLVKKLFLNFKLSVSLCSKPTFCCTIRCIGHCQNSCTTKNSVSNYKFQVVPDYFHVEKSGIDIH